MNAKIHGGVYTIYDAARTLAAFSATLRTEVDLSQLSEHLLALVEETMQPGFAALWLRQVVRDGNQRTPWSDNPPVDSPER